MDLVLLIGAALLLWIVLALAFAPIVGRTISRKSRFESQDREQLGLLEHQRAESRARVERALARHETRKSA